MTLNIIEMIEINNFIGIHLQYWDDFLEPFELFLYVVCPQTFFHQNCIEWKRRKVIPNGYTLSIEFKE